jgi:hypothetical protein
MWRSGLSATTLPIGVRAWGAGGAQRARVWQKSIPRLRSLLVLCNSIRSIQSLEENILEAQWTKPGVRAASVVSKNVRG